MKRNWLTQCSLCKGSFNKTRYAYAKIEDQEFCSTLCLHHAMERFDFLEEKRNKEKRIKIILYSIVGLASILTVCLFMR